MLLLIIIDITFELSFELSTLKSFARQKLELDFRHSKLSATQLCVFGS